MHLDIGGTGGAFMTSLRQLNRFEARISLFKSLECPLALVAAGRNQRFTRYPPEINHNLGWCNLVACHQHRRELVQCHKMCLPVLQSVFQYSILVISCDYFFE